MSRFLAPAVTVRCTHHGNLYAHVAQSSDAICPVSFDWGAPLELEAKFGEELNGGIDVFYHDADIVHSLDRHDVSLASGYGIIPIGAGSISSGAGTISTAPAGSAVHLNRAGRACQFTSDFSPRQGCAQLFPFGGWI